MSLVNNVMNVGGAGMSLKVVGGKTIAGQYLMERDNKRARTHRPAGYRAGLKCIEEIWVQGFRVHCRANRTGRVAGGRFGEVDSIGQPAGSSSH